MTEWKNYTLTSTIAVKADSVEYTFDINFKINDSLVANNGYNDLYRLSRLKWLNSTLAQDDILVKPYISPKLKCSVIGTVKTQL